MKNILVFFLFFFKGFDSYCTFDEKVIGTSGGVFFADVTNTVVVPSQNTFYAGVSTHYLTQDDSIDLTNGTEMNIFKL